MKLILTSSFIVILISIFLLKATDQTNHYQVQNNFDTNTLTAVIDGQQFTVPVSLAEIHRPQKVLGSTNGEKVIYVDLDNQRLYAYEGETLIYSFLVSTGKWGRTPTGTFTIANKFRYVRMTGGSKVLHTYYDLPNVPFTMFFGNDQIPASKGFSLHGAYWHNNFGHPMSHGCVNMKISEAGILYDWANPQLPEGKNSTVSTKTNPGTKVIIYGVTPQS